MSNLFGGTPLPGRFDRVEKADLTGVTKVASTMDVRDKEMARRFERAEDFRRTDINEAVGYDLASIGQFGSEIFNQEANEVAQMIASGELDPTQARMRLGQLKGMYNQFKTHADAMAAEDEIAKQLATDPQARAARNAQLGVGEELSFGIDDYAAQHNAAMNNLFKPGSAQKGADGQWTAIDPNTNQRVPITQITGFADPTHFYRYGTKSVDVGTLGDWAQNSATASAISFKDGKWDEARARDYYRDNILTQDENGRTRRLQLLGTLEDRGLISHLTDEQKRNFRDGVDLGSETFQDIITKGETEFVSRSQFEGVYGTAGKKGSGSGSGGGQDKADFVVGGLNVPAKTTEKLLSNLENIEQSGYTLNRFNTPPVLEGAYEIPGKPNTEKIEIVGAGVNEKGEPVAYIRGYQRTEIEGAIPGLDGETDRVPYFKEIAIGEGEVGVGSDIMRELQQNHPKMYNQVLQDKDVYEENKLRGKGIRAAGAEDGGADETTPDTGDAADRSQAALGARDAAVDEYRNLINEYEELNKQINTYPNTAPAAISRQRALKERMNVIAGGEFGEYINNIFNEGAEATPEDARSASEAALAAARERSQTGSMTREEIEASREARSEAARIEREKRNIIQQVSDTLLDNPIGRFFGYQGREDRERGLPDSGVQPEPIAAKVQFGGTPGSRDEVLPLSPGGGVSPIDIPTVARGLQPERPAVSELATNLVGGGLGSNDGGIASYEGYTPSMQINVPDSLNSGVTIAGLDIGRGAEGADGKLAILKDYLRPEDFKALETLKGLTGKEAKKALNKFRDQGLLLQDGLGLTQGDLNEITARQTEKELPKVYKKLPKDRLEKLPIEVQRAVVGVDFMTPGKVAIGLVSKAVESNAPEDWTKAANEYMNYYSYLGSSDMKSEFKKWARQNNREDLIDQIDQPGKTQEFKDAVIQYKLDAKRILPGNLRRVEEAANNIISAYNLEPIPTYAERSEGGAPSDEVAVN